MLDLGGDLSPQLQQRPLLLAAATTTPTSGRQKNNGKSRLRNLLAAIFNPSSGKSKQRMSTATNFQPQPQRKLNNESFHLNRPTGTNAIYRDESFFNKSKSQNSIKQQYRLSLGRDIGSKTPATSRSSQQQVAVSTSSLKRVKSSQAVLAAAQQTSYETMRTIDLYLIRQIARNCMDFEMEQKIELEIRLRELACQSLLEARDEIDVLEVEKALLASDQRMNCYAIQLEFERKKLASAATDGSLPRASKQFGRQVAKSNSTPATDANSGHRRQSDIVGVQQVDDHGYLSISDLASSNESPSKLSPVSGKSANSSSQDPTASAAAGQQQDQYSVSGRASFGRTASRSRTNPLKQKANNGNQQTSGATDKKSLPASNDRVASSCNSLSKQQSIASRSLASKKRAKLMLQQEIAKASNINCNIVSNNRATLSISELRIPLMWRDVDHFKGRGDYRRYATFCLLKINSQIYDTQLITDVDRQMTDVNFDDVIIFQDVEHDFELTLEVYSCVYLEEFSLSSTPRKLKEKFSNSLGRAMGRRLANQTASDNFTRELDAYQEKSYRFTMIASASFHLEDAQNCVKTYDLHLVSPEAHHRRPSLGNLLHSNAIGGGCNTLSRSRQSSPWSSSSGGGMVAQYCDNSQLVSASNLRESHKNTLPLFGHFCCKITIKPDVFDKCVKTGYLRVASIEIPQQVVGQQQVVGDTGGSPTGSTGQDATSTSPDSAASLEQNTHSPTSSPQSTLMLRSALAASSKLATMSLQSASIHWALLRNFALHLWPVDERRIENSLRRGHAPQVDISHRPPFTISIDKFTRLLRVSNSSLTLESEQGCFVFAVFDPCSRMEDEYQFINRHQHHHQVAQPRDQIAHWLRPIEQLIYDSHIWASVLNHYPSTAHRRKSGSTQQRHRLRELPHRSARL